MRASSWGSVDLLRFVFIRVIREDPWWFFQRLSGMESGVEIFDSRRRRRRRAGG